MVVFDLRSGSSATITHRFAKTLALGPVHPPVSSSSSSSLLRTMVPKEGFNLPPSGLLRRVSGSFTNSGLDEARKFHPDSGAGVRKRHISNPGMQGRWDAGRNKAIDG